MKLLLFLLLSPARGMELKGSIPAAAIQASAVDTNKLANDAVTSAKIIDNGIATADIAGSAVTGAKLGTGTRQLLYSVASSTMSSGETGEIITYSYTLAANSLSAAGDAVYIHCASSKTSTSWTANNSAYFGSTIVSDGGVASTANNWTTWSRVIYRSSTALLWDSIRVRDTNTTAEQGTTTFGDPTVANVLTCRVVANGVAGDVVGLYMQVYLEKAP